MNSVRLILIGAVAACSAIGLYLWIAGLNIDQRPNFVIIVADDLSWNDLGAYGNPGVYTPVIDDLASRGVRFTNAFLTTSSCSASRASILTGRYPHSNGLLHLHTPLPGFEKTLGHYLGREGYFTGAVGKWHLGREVVGQFDRVVRDRSESGTESWEDFLRKRPDDRPFFIWMASKDPHIPHEGGREFRQHYSPESFTLPSGFVDGEGVRQELLEYYLEVSRFDADVGRVLAELERQGELDNTLVIVMADNGRPFHRNKLSLYDGGIRTPLVLHWPAGDLDLADYEHMISSIDIAPTLLELTGAAVPEKMQGVSFADALINSRGKTRDHVFAERNDHDKPAHERAVRSMHYLYKENQYPLGGDCRETQFAWSSGFRAMQNAFRRGQLDAVSAACFDKRRARVELFAVSEAGVDFLNLADDPAHAEVRREMAGLLARWREKTGDFDFDPDTDGR